MAARVVDKLTDSRLILGGVATSMNFLCTWRRTWNPLRSPENFRTWPCLQIKQSNKSLIKQQNNPSLTQSVN